MKQRKCYNTQKARRQVHNMSPCSYHSLHDSIPSGKDTCTPARSSDLSMVQSNNSCPDWRPRLNYSTHKARQNFCTTSPCPYHSLHETIPSGKDTCTPAWSSDLSMVRSNNSCPDWRLRRCYNTHKAGQKSCTTSPCPYHSLHDTIPSGKDRNVHARSVLGLEHGPE